MKILLTAAPLSLVTSFAYAAEARDWHDLEKVHKHIQESIKELERARAGMGGSFTTSHQCSPAGRAYDRARLPNPATVHEKLYRS